MSGLALRFSNPETHTRLRLVADELGTSMNRLVEDMIERELDALSMSLEAELQETIERLRKLRHVDIERSVQQWAAAEGQADPIVARANVEEEDPFGIAAAFGR